MPLSLRFFAAPKNNVVKTNQCCDFAKFADAMPSHYRGHRKFLIPYRAAVYRGISTAIFFYIFLKDQKRRQNFESV